MPYVGIATCHTSEPLDMILCISMSSQISIFRIKSASIESAGVGFISCGSTAVVSV